MSDYSRKIFIPQSKQCPLGFLLALFLITSGCISPNATELYKNPELGISLEKPGNWDLIFYERTGTIVLETKNGSSALIEINGNACTDSTFNTSKDHIEATIARIGNLYYLSTVTVVQEPTRIESENYEVVEAIIMIPTTSIPEDSPINQTGDRGPNIFQVIEISDIKDDSGNSVMVYFYKGNSEELNTEAEEIVNSIQITCSTKP